MDGRYVTATYSLGKLALWAPDGQLLEVIGDGPGEGPGEFDYPSGFAQVAEDEFLVLTGRSVIHKYSTAGHFLRSLHLPAGGGADSLVVARDWFPGPRENEAHLSWIHADGRGLIWTVVDVADPDAPPGSLPTWDVGAAEEQPIDDDPEALAAIRIKTRDTVVEAFTPDGRLVASTRFDSFRDAAIPMRGNLWYNMTEDMMSLIVLEAVLVQPG